MHQIELRQITLHDVTINVAQVGVGRPVLLIHGWPHTWMLWREAMPLLAASGYRVIAPDLRGLGGSSRAANGYDLHTLADDLAALLRGLDEKQPVLIASMDLGSPIAFMFAMRHRNLVRGLSVSETLLGDLPGAEDFTKNGPPWWFGFHVVPGLAESVLVGHEAEYLDWFLRSGTKNGKGVNAEVRDAFVEAYSGPESLRCGFEYYRKLGNNAVLIREALASGRLTVPTLAIIGGLTGDAVFKQLLPFTDDLQRIDIHECGHLIPLEQPRAYVDALLSFDKA